MQKSSLKSRNPLWNPLWNVEIHFEIQKSTWNPEIQSEIRNPREIQWISKSRTPRRAVADPSDFFRDGPLGPIFMPGATWVRGVIGVTWWLWDSKWLLFPPFEPGSSPSDSQLMVTTLNSRSCRRWSKEPSDNRTRRRQQLFPAKKSKFLTAKITVSSFPEQNLRPKKAGNAISIGNDVIFELAVNITSVMIIIAGASLSKQHTD